jgi:hypothetical protein
MNYKVNPFLYIKNRLRLIWTQIDFAIGAAPYYQKKGEASVKKCIGDIFRLIVDPYLVCAATTTLTDYIYLGKNTYIVYKYMLYTRDPVVLINHFGDIDLSERNFNTDIGIHIISKKFYNFKDKRRSQEDIDFYNTLSKDDWNKIIEFIDEIKDTIWKLDHFTDVHKAVKYDDTVFLNVRDVLN